MKVFPTLITILLSVLVAAAAGAGGAWWVLSHGIAHVPLNGQAMAVTMPDGLPVRVDVLQAGGPSGGGLPVRLDENLDLDVAVDTEVPLALTVNYQGEIPVQTEVPVDTDIQTEVLGVPVQLPIRGSIPLDFKLPVDLTIPIHQPVRLKFTAPITARVDQVVNIPLEGTLDARIRFDGPAIPLRVDDSELALPLDRVWLSGEATGWRLGPLESTAD